MKLLLILVTALMLAGCAATEEKPAETKTVDTKADVDALNKLREDFNAAFNAGDATRIGDLYSENATVIPGDGSPSVQGRAAIVARNKALFEQVSAKLSITPTRNAVAGDLGYDQGTYRLEMTPKKPGSKPVIEEGRYVVVLHREADGWRIIEDIDNRIKK